MLLIVDYALAITMVWIIGAVYTFRSLPSELEAAELRAIYCTDSYIDDDL